MEVASNDPSPNNAKALFSFCSQYLRNRLRFFDSYLSKILCPSSKKRHRRSLPLPLPSAASTLDPASVTTSRIFEALEDIIAHTLRNLHIIQKNLAFWQSRAELSNAQKAYFMMCQRGPFAFIQTIWDGHGHAHATRMRKLYSSANSHISERIRVLTSLRCLLATFLAKVYEELDKAGEDLVKDPEKSLPSLLVSIGDVFSKLEASIGHFHENCQTGSSVDGGPSLPPTFAKPPEVNQEGSQWIECKDAINWISKNLQRLDTYLSVLVFKHRRPRKITIHWMSYSCGIFGVSICSLWLLRHSKLMGSSDIENWISEAKASTVSFWKDHVEQPILAIRDELFETFRKRQKGVMARAEVQLTSDSLHRMLLAYSEQAARKNFQEDASDQKMREILMLRHEKELMHPMRGLVCRELVRSLLIQVQKQKLDIDEAMLELDQILRANEINFAILAALPAFFLSLVLAMLVRAWFKQNTKAEGRGRVARIQMRLMLVEIERAIMQFQSCTDQKLENDAQCMYGLVLYFLGSLYGVVESHARETGEWICLRQDIIDLAKPGLLTESKLRIASRMKRV